MPAGWSAARSALTRSAWASALVSYRSRSAYGRIERDDGSDIGVLELSRALAVVGLELSARAYPRGSAIRDHAHRDLLARFAATLAPTFTWRTEVPLPNPGDLRAWDGVARDAELLVGVECEMRPTDWQALDRRIQLKRRDGGVDRVILILPKSYGHVSCGGNHQSRRLR